jgi:hypothetical protein
MTGSASLLARTASYSRWKDERFWPAFRDALRREHPILTEEALHKAKEFNSQRYYYQGIGRHAPSAAYARGLADLQVLANLIPADEYLHGPKPTSIDAAIYGFIANIYFYEIDTPLKQFVASHPNLVRHCTAIHAPGPRRRIYAARCRGLLLQGPRAAARQPPSLSSYGSKSGTWHMCRIYQGGAR